MTIRDPYVKSKALFDKRYNYYMEWFVKDIEILKKVPDDSMPFALADTLKTKLELLTLCYSRGDDLDQIKAMLPDVLEDFFKADDANVEAEEEPLWNSTGTDEAVLSLMSFCYCLGLEEHLLQRFLNRFKPEGKNRLIDRLIAVYQPDRNIADLKAWSIANAYLAKDYRFLADMIDAPQKQQIKLANKHLKKYDKNLKIYKRPLDENDVYNGLWSFDLALVVKAFNLDDSELKDNPFYPTDLVHYQDKA